MSTMVPGPDLPGGARLAARPSKPHRIQRKEQ